MQGCFRDGLGTCGFRTADAFDSHLVFAAGAVVARELGDFGVLGGGQGDVVGGRLEHVEDGGAFEGVLADVGGHGVFEVLKGDGAFEADSFGGDL